MSLMLESEKRVVDEVKEAARREGVPPEKIASLISKGRLVMPHNHNHSPVPTLIGEGVRIKINANIGTSPDRVDISEEIRKADIAVRYGAHTVMDLSTGGDLDALRKKILSEVKVPLGTVPIYQAAIEAGNLHDMDEDHIFRVIEKHGRQGVDFITVHCGITKDTVSTLKKHSRVGGQVSRGGCFLSSWISHHNRENPLYESYDQLLDIAEEYEMTLSLGDGIRPGAIHDATDAPQIHELIVLGELVKRARKRGVQVMVEGPGHVPLDQIEANVRAQKTICDGAPFYVLGPLVTDIAAGYDHIAGAIGGALAAYFGADFLCYLTPAEHLGLPDMDEVKEGVIASRIAAHVGDLMRGFDWDMDLEMSRARRRLDWEKMYTYMLDLERAKHIRERSEPRVGHTCTMCGEYCAVALSREFLKDTEL